MKSRLRVPVISLRVAALCLLLASGAGGQGPMWTLLGPGSGPRQFHLMAVDPQAGQVLYAGGREGLYKSQDRGNTWQRVFGEEGPSWVSSYAEGGPRAIAVAPRDSRVIFFGGEQGVYRSTDGGQSWQQVSKVNARALAIDPQGLDVVAASGGGRTIYVGGDHRIYKSVDQGGKWQLVKDSLDVYVITIDPQDHQVVYAGCQEGLYRSKDSGTNWDALYKGSFSHLVIDPRDTQVLYALSNDTVRKSTEARTAAGPGFRSPNSVSAASGPCSPTPGHRRGSTPWQKGWSTRARIAGRPGSTGAAA